MAYSSIAKGIWGAGKLFLGGGLGRQAAIGGALGFAMPSETFENPNLDFENRVKEAVIGAGAVAAFWKAPQIISKVAKAGYKGVGSLTNATKTLGPVGKFALNHPFMTAGIAAGAYSASNINSGYTSPTLSGAKVDANYASQEVSSNLMSNSGIIGTGFVGSAPQMAGRYYQSLTGSTNGLVQGLNRGRHG